MRLGRCNWTEFKSLIIKISLMKIKAKLTLINITNRLKILKIKS